MVIFPLAPDQTRQYIYTERHADMLTSIKYSD